MSFLLTPERTQEAIQLIRPAINVAMERKVFKRKHLHVVILDPAVPYGSEIHLPILCEEQWGDPRDWEHDYQKIAHDKAFLSWKHRLSTEQLQLMAPYLCEGHDTLYWGSVCDEGIVVAASGLQQWFDQMVARIIAAACKALCREALEWHKKEAVAQAYTPSLYTSLPQPYGGVKING
ncbi:hypothetical protein HY523_02735 [Candidatus Berkelbacteria bacterium]|nr:hypothetical protein [Candidatus Berkelbacteria bacterium]